MPHQSHCCIDHGCKYNDDDCPVTKGIVKQDGLCEQYGLETEGYYSSSHISREQQAGRLADLWAHAQIPDGHIKSFLPGRSIVVSETTKSILVGLCKSYSLATVSNILTIVHALGSDLKTVLAILTDLEESHSI